MNLSPASSSQIRIAEVASRIKEMRNIMGFSTAAIAEMTDMSEEQYLQYESGKEDLPFSFIYSCAKAFNMELTELLEGNNARLSSFTITRRGMGQLTTKEDGIEISNMAPLFRKKVAEPYWVTYKYDETLQNKPIHTSVHNGQEFDIIISGQLKIKIGEHTTILNEGDSIYYDSSTPHGMIATGGKDCTFCAVILPGEKSDYDEKEIQGTLVPDKLTEPLAIEDFIKVDIDAQGVPVKVSYNNVDNYNFAFDTIDRIADATPDKEAMIYVDDNLKERIITYGDLKKNSNRCANYFLSLGIKKGDNVLLILKRHWQFWYAVLGLHKLGAVAIPATNQLKVHDLEFRFNKAHVKAIICTADGDISEQADIAMQSYDGIKVKILANGHREGWRCFDDDFERYSTHFDRTEDTPKGDDTMLMLFTSGTTGYPRLVSHSYKYVMGHYMTARYWHGVDPDGVHFTISETGWAKSLWGKLYGQWMCEGRILVYDFNRFKADKVLSVMSKHKVTSFCAPPTMYRMLLQEDFSKYDLSSIKEATTAGEALNTEAYYKFEHETGLKIRQGFGQTETTLSIATLRGMVNKEGSMGKPLANYDISIMNHDGKICDIGESGEIVIKTSEAMPLGLFQGYYEDEEETKEKWYDGYYHTGDAAWMDEDGYYRYIGRVDDVIKSSGYRIGPFEIEDVILKLPYVLECGVSAAPDEVRGQIVKASIVLKPGVEGTESLKKDIQEYVKKNTAPYKYPRLIVFKDSLPKTISGKVIRRLL
ncbi:MAG: AMP-binding protein [Bacteroidia bacterium]|nr:AMP-binding protein [Bacteroidia bacterium]